MNWSVLAQHNWPPGTERVDEDGLTSLTRGPDPGVDQQGGGWDL